MPGLNGHGHTVVDKNLEKISNSLWGYFIKNRRMAIMIGLIFVVTGMFSYFKIPRESNPEVEVPYGMVVTSYPGASPQEVAEQVTFKIEQKIKGLSDVEEMTSTSSEGMSQIFVEFDAEADLDDSIRKLKDKVDEAKTSLPDDANDPFVQELSFSDTPIVTFSFFGDLPYEQLLAVVEDVQNEMEKVPGVQNANIVGKRDTHILVAVREAAMVQYGLSMSAISQAIAAFHMNGPVGNIEVDDLFYRVRISAEQEDVERIESIPIMQRNGAIIYVKDVAMVTEEFREETTRSRISINGEPSFTAVSISVVKKTGSNIIETVDALEEIIETLEADHSIPSEVDYLAINDMSDQVRSDFNTLMVNAMGTIGLIFIVLYIALGFKEALIGGIAIPFTFLVAFTFLYKIGYSFNFLVLFSLILGLGLLVDTTIVMMEGMHEYLYKDKMTPVNAALKTVKVYRYSLMSGLLTTVAAFLPMYLMSGILGQFFKFIPTTVSVVLISAFFIGLLIIPSYAVIFMHKVKTHEKEGLIGRHLREKRQKMVDRVAKLYSRFLHSLLEHQRRRRIFLGTVILLFFSALALPVLGLVKVEGFPLVDIDYMYINVEAPVGSTLARLEPVVRRIEAVIQEDPNIESYIVNLGTGGSQSLEGDIAAGAGSTHLASMTLNFVEEDERSDMSFAIAEQYKDKLNFITEADITVPELRSGPPTGSAIQVLIFGEDYSVLQQISSDVQTKLKEVGGAQVDDDISTSTAEFTFDFSSPYSKAVLKNHDLSVAQVAQEVRMAVYPTTAATIKRGEDEIDIDVQRQWMGYKPHSIDAVEQIRIQNSQGEYVTLGSLALPQVGASLTSINHYDSEQAVIVGADVASGKVPADVLAELVPYLDTYDWPDGYSYKITGGNEDTMQSFRDLMNAMVLGVLMIFLILVTQFNSFKHPFVILLSLPLSLIGVLYGFAIFQLNVGVATMIGIVALSGIVINDAIILIDRINHNRRKQKMTLKAAVFEAGPARMQPIFITSITTVLGILPISLTDAFWTTLGMAIVFGMIFSTVLTLLIIPVFYYSLELRAEAKRVRA